MIRTYTGDDLRRIKMIHKNHHEKDFDLDDFLDDKTLERIVVTDDINGDIITAASLRTLVEIIAITDMSKTVRERRIALIRLLQAASFITKTYGYKELHCFPLTNEEWTEHLKDYGFNPTKGQSLFIGV